MTGTTMRRGAATLLAGLSFMALAGVARAQEDAQPSIERLLADGWKVTGYVAQGTTYILFGHPDRHYLVQCSVLYDTTRGARQAERVRTNCYELH
jgi:hypothetical protein